MNTELIKEIWGSYAESHGFNFESSERKIMLAGTKMELILSKNDSIIIRGVFQLDITGWGQGRGPLNKTTVRIKPIGKNQFVDNKESRKKFGYKKTSMDSDELTIEYRFIFENMDSFDLLEELLLVYKVTV